MKVERRLVGFIVFAMVASVAHARTDQNSFLNKPANTLPALIDQIKTDSQVGSRFMRHFGMGKEELLDMVSKFKLGRLPSDGVYVVYNVPSWEEVRARALMMKKGTLVWTDQEGTPILKASCGNPMTRGTDIGLAVATPGIHLSPSAELRDLIVMSVPETAFMDEAPSLAAPTPVEVSAMEVAPVAPVIPSYTTPISGLIIPVAAGLLLGLNQGDTPPVPEPCTMVIAGGALAAFVVRRRRRR